MEREGGGERMGKRRGDGEERVWKGGEEGGYGQGKAWEVEREEEGVGKRKGGDKKRGRGLWKRERRGKQGKWKGEMRGVEMGEGNGERGC